MTTAATSMATMRPVDLDELRGGELLTMIRRTAHISAMRDAPCEVLARVSVRAGPEGSAR